MFSPDRLTPELRKITVGANLKYNQVTIGASATRFTATSTVLVNGVIIQALSTNSNSCYIGDSNVTTSNGFELQAGQAVSVSIDDLSRLYVAGTNGEKICYIAVSQ